MKKTLIVIGSIVVFLMFLSIAAKLYDQYGRSAFDRCGPGGCDEPGLRDAPPDYKESASYSAPEGGYECSRPIRLVSTTVNASGERRAYTPVDAEEARVLCHMTYAIEYKGKLEILRRPDVIEFMRAYEYKDMSIKALEFELIGDKDFVHRLLPTFADKEIGCVIVLETPGGNRVYLEDENLETFEEMDFTAFEKLLENVSDTDRALFYMNLH